MKIFFSESLSLELYLIGYKEQGESFVFVIKADGNNVYCGVVDCYEHDSLNMTMELLERLSIIKVDFVCWTHPDLDHSLGLFKVLEKYIDLSVTKIVLPENVSGREYEYHPELAETFSFINGGIRPAPGQKKLDVKSASDYKILFVRDFISSNMSIYNMTIHSIAPNSTIVRSRAQIHNPLKNDFSIGLVLSIGGINVLLSGDCENYTIRNFEDYYIPDKIEYIKIPHHTSTSSDALLILLNKENKSEVACTTVFRQHNLPHRPLINLYKDCAEEFYSTGSQQVVPNCNYGIVKTTFDIVNKRYKTELEGNALQEF